MIVCAQCGKKNKDNATECKYCGYNPSALQQNNATWGYQNSAYPPMQYQPPMMPQGGQQYYDANGKAYTVRYDYKVTPVEEDDEDDEGEGTQKMTLYPYNPTLMQQQAQQTEAPKKPVQRNAMAWIAYVLAMFFDILAWPFCWIGLIVANKRDGARKELCEGGMMFTLMRLVTALCLFLVWWGMTTYMPSFFVGVEPWKEAIVKIILFGWPIAVGSIFMEASAPESGLEAAGKGYFYFSIAVALLGVIFFDVTWLPIFS